MRVRSQGRYAKLGIQKLLNDVESNFKLYLSTGNEQKHLNNETYTKLKEAIKRKLANDFPDLFESLFDDVSTIIISDIFMKVKNLHNNGLPWNIKNFINYLSSVLKNKVMDQIRLTYYRDVKIELIDLDEVKDIVTTDSAPNINYTNAEYLAILDSDLKSINHYAMSLLSSSILAPKAKVLVWPLVVASLRNRDDFFRLLSPRQFYCMRYMIHLLRLEITKNFYQYRLAI